MLSISNKKQKGEDGKNLHDTEKPVELMKILIANSTNPNDIVVDPFVGIGGVAKACKELGRRFIVCDMEEKYCNITKDALIDMDLKVS